MSDRPSADAAATATGGAPVDPGAGPGAAAPQASPGAPSHRAILAIAFPVIIANITTPLIGIVDTAVIGQLGPAYLLGAVAVGALIFDFVFWVFGFLRMGTTALTAQADGARDVREMKAVLVRAGLISLALGLLVIGLQSPIRALAFHLVPGSAEMEASARVYFDIRIWSAPAVLANYAILGWLIGRGQATTALVLQLVLNLSNIALNLVLVLGLGMGIAGVALGSVAAEVIAVVVGLGIVGRAFGWHRALADLPLAQILDAAQVVKTLALNGNIMIRTICMELAFAFFTIQGAASGDTILAANAIGMHFVVLVAYLVDGFAFATERFVGQAVGARDRDALVLGLQRTSVWALGVGLLLALLGVALGGVFIAMMTVNEGVRATAAAYWWWAALAPLIGVASYQLDGAFIGAARGRDMRNMMAVSLLVYLAFWFALSSTLAVDWPPEARNHLLWSAIWVFLLARGVTLAVRLPALFAEVPIREQVGSPQR